MVKIREEKESTYNKPIKKARLPVKVFIPLSQHFGKPAVPIIKVKDRVRAGQLIATADSGLFSPVHASISGVVAAIQDYAHPTLGRQKAIVIEGDGSDDEVSFNLKSQEETDRLSPEEIKKIVFASGVVGLGGAVFPTHIKLAPPKPIKYFILNGAECEPYLTADFRLMAERASEVINGARIISNIFKGAECVIAIEDNKPEAIAAMSKASAGTIFKIKILKTAYPQGGEKQLIQSVLKKEVPSGGLPFDIGVVVHNVGTAYAIYEAVYKNKPLYERVVTLTGSPLSNPGNFLVRVGTPVSALLEECGPLKAEITKVVFGGPMMGIAQYTLDVPVIKGTSGIIFFSKKEIIQREERVCCRCGRCIDVCPVRIMPALIGMAAEKERWDIAATYDCLDCIECGLCSYICPAKRDLIHLIKYAKARVKK